MNRLMMKWAAMAALLLFASCSTTSTGRSRIVWFPEDYMNSMGAQAYEGATGDYPEITSGPQYEMVQRLGERIKRAASLDSERARQFDWKFKLLDAPQTVNAFALPGGKVAIYTGILRVAQNEDALAAVVGHEIAHATEQHGNERMTQNMLSTGLMTAVQVGLSSWGGMSAADRDGWMAALGTGAQVGVLLPFSRKHESEADEVGLRYLIRAGYDPYEAPKLWERMAELSGGGGAHDPMTATHPDPLERAARLRELIPSFVEQERGNIQR